MKTDPQQVRLPELPIFKKYSLALREEYARASDILALLERTGARIQQMVDKAEEELRRQEAEQARAAEEIEAERDLQDEAEEFAGSGIEDEGAAVEASDIPDDPPFWEMDLPDEDPPAKPKPKPRAKAVPKKKPKVVRSGIVHVGDHGKPVKKTAASRTSAGPKPKAKPTRAKASPAARKKKR